MKSKISLALSLLDREGTCSSHSRIQRSILTCRYLNWFLIIYICLDGNKKENMHNPIILLALLYKNLFVGAWVRMCTLEARRIHWIYYSCSYRYLWAAWHWWFPLGEQQALLKPESPCQPLKCLATCKGPNLCLSTDSSFKRLQYKCLAWWLMSLILVFWRQRQADFCALEALLVYIVYSSPVRTTQWDPVWKIVK